MQGKLPESVGFKWRLRWFEKEQGDQMLNYLSVCGGRRKRKRKNTGFHVWRVRLCYQSDRKNFHFSAFETMFPYYLLLQLSKLYLLKDLSNTIKRLSDTVVWIWRHAVCGLSVKQKSGDFVCSVQFSINIKTLERILSFEKLEEKLERQKAIWFHWVSLLIFK